MGKTICFKLFLMWIVVVTAQSQTDTTGNVPPTVPEVITPVQPPTVDDACLHCICQASSQCRPLSCHLASPGRYYCGPYLISWAYWADSGKPQDDIGDPYAFEKCLKNKECAEQSVRGYMARYGQDCNSDNQINCIDYARIHKSGPFGCNATWIDDTNYFKAFMACFSKPKST